MKRTVVIPDDPADLTNREAATAWGQGGPCAHDASGAVMESYQNAKQIGSAGKQAA